MRRDLPRGFEFALFGISLLWALAASVIAGKAARGIAGRFGLDAMETLLEAVFLIFLVVLGFQFLDWIATRQGEMVDVLPLPRRAGWSGEFGVGAAIGWGLCLAAVLPVLLTGNLHGRVRGTGAGLASAGLAVLTLGALTLAEELIARGYGFQRLMGAVGSSWASVITSVGFAGWLVWTGSPMRWETALVVGTLLGIVLAMAYLRTRALWVGWGLHFGFRVVMAVVLGLPVAGRSDFGSLADVFTTGPGWLTGEAFGLDAAIWTGAAMLGAMVVLYRVTREYAWAYTAPVLVGAGYEVEVAAPAAHVAMEKPAGAVVSPALVQILPSTSQTRSAGENLPE